MLKIMRYISKKQWFYIGICVLFVVGQVWLDLKLPDYMREITSLITTQDALCAIFLRRADI